jgi:hypothetical protein
MMTLQYARSERSHEDIVDDELDLPEKLRGNVDIRASNASPHREKQGGKLAGRQRRDLMPLTI